MSNGGVFYPNYKMAKKLFVRPFLIMLQNAGIKYNFNKQDMIIETAYGYVCIMTMERPGTAVGDEWTWCLIDEFDKPSYQRCKDTWEMVIGRMRGGDNSQIFIVTTAEGYKLTYELESSGDIRAIHAKSTDNPYLSKHYIADMLKLYDEQLVKQYIMGEYVNLNGKQAYYAFMRSRHIMADTKPYKFTTGNLYIGIDFNIDHFSIAVSELVTIDGKQVLMVGREHRFKNFYTRDAVNLIEDLYQDYQINICPDMTGKARKTSAELTDLVILRKGVTKFGAFRIIGDVNPTHRDRINTVNNSLDKIKVQIHSSCVWLIGDLEKVVTDEYGFIDKSQEQQGLVHMSDAFGYTIINLFPLSQRAFTRVG
jgi:hypothetical protein